MKQFTIQMYVFTTKTYFVNVNDTAAHMHTLRHMKE
jgi:hypothetical protein